MEIPKILQDDLNKKAKLFFKTMKRNCKQCHGKGYIEDEETVTFKDCPECTERLLSFKKYLDSNIQADYLRIDLNQIANVYTKECFEGYTKLLENITRLFGKYNIMFVRGGEEYTFGITTAGVLCIKKFIDANYSSIIVDIAALFDCFFNFNDDSETNIRRSRLLDYYSSVPVLMLDGLGSEMNKDAHGYVYGKLAAFLNNRRQQNKFTIICADSTMENIERRYDTSIVSLLKTYLTFQVKCNDDKKRATPVAKFDEEFPELKSVTNNLHGKPKIIKVPTTKVVRGNPDGERKN